MAVNWKNKRVLVTGAAGMIGKELCILLKDKGVILYETDLKGNYGGYDLTNLNTCMSLCLAIDYVFHLAGIKGSPRMTKERPVDFMRPMLQFDTNMIHAAQACNVKRFLYTSSIAVLNPESDKYPAWAKRTGELLCEAMHIQYPQGTKYCIVRPANVYGRFDNFDNQNAMVITSLIRKFINDDEIHVWGDGTEERDFINAKDVARGMITTMEQIPEEPINLCSGDVSTIKEAVEAIQMALESKKRIVYEKSKATGDKRRVMPKTKLKGFKARISLIDGIEEVATYARDSFYTSNKR